MAADLVSHLPSTTYHLPLIVIVGPTASGKTALAVELAKRYEGEIICADSRTVYKDMDIGTAKPTIDERRAVPHWGIDLVEPGQRFTAADFKRYADAKIAEIRQRKHVPFLVGGTGLYIDAVTQDFGFAGAADILLRTKLEALTLEELWQYCDKNNIKLPQNRNNKRYLIRTIERNGAILSRNSKTISISTIVGIATDKAELRSRIAARAEHLFDAGVVEEAKRLGKKYGWDSEAMTGNIYPLIRQLLEGALTKPEAVEKFIAADWQLAKRQMTWFRRNPDIMWATWQEAARYIDTVLKQYIS